ARLVDRADQRNVDQRRAEAREAAHQPGQRRDNEGRDETALAERGGEDGEIGKVGHASPGKGEARLLYESPRAAYSAGWSFVSCVCGPRPPSFRCSRSSSR